MTGSDTFAAPTVTTTARNGGAREFLIVGLSLGLAYGLAEAIESCLLGLYPGALSWRSANSPRVLWVAPIVYAIASIVLALTFYAMSRWIRRWDWTRVFVFVALVGGGYLGARLQGQIFAPWASLLLALGIGTQLTRMFSRRRAQALALMRRTLIPLAGLVVVIAFGEISTTSALERAARAKLPAAEPRPNVLVLVADTLRADHVSGYGYARPTTPRIDRFASEAWTFVAAYSASSWTLPAHASLMTGRRMYEHRAGEQGRPYLDRRFATLAEVLGAAGYVSGGFVANTFWCGRQTGLDRGFIHYEDFYGNVGDALARTVLGRTMAYQVLPRAGLVDFPGRKRAADINARVLDWIDGIGDRPFFVFANYMDVHGPYIPPPSYEGRFGAKGPSRRANEIELGAIDGSTTVPDAAVLRAWIDRYDESLLYLDEQIGLLLDELARRGVLDKTIVVFTSDHGENWGEHNLIYHGHSLYQEQIRIPLIVRFPARVAAGKRDARPVALEQLPSLIADLAGISGAPFPGRSLDTDAARGIDDVAVSEVGRRSGVPLAWPTASGGLRSLQTDRWQLIVKEAGPMELYDLDTDPRQLNNVAGDPRFTDVLASMQRRLAVEVPVPVSRTQSDGIFAR
jgi:arylsulfatase A-like enzyme